MRYIWLLSMTMVSTVMAMGVLDSEKEETSQASTAIDIPMYPLAAVLTMNQYAGPSQPRHRGSYSPSEYCDEDGMVPPHILLESATQTSRSSLDETYSR